VYVEAQVGNRARDGGDYPVGTGDGFVKAQRSTEQRRLAPTFRGRNSGTICLGFVNERSATGDGRDLNGRSMLYGKDSGCVSMMRIVYIVNGQTICSSSQLREDSQ